MLFRSKVEYQKESFILFEAMLGRIREQSVEYIYKVETPRIPPPPPPPTILSGPEGAAPPPPEEKKSSNGKGSLLKKQAQEQEPAPVPEVHKIGRNDPCFCGSNKKYKKCHGS